MLGAQLDLFNDRHLRLEEARRALADGRTQDACRELFRLRDCYPEDPGIAAELDLAQTLMHGLGEIEALAPGERPGPLVELARATTGGLRAALLRRAAATLRQAGGSAALLDDKAASVLLLEAGDVHTAWATAVEAARDSRRARFLAYLADVEHRLDHKSRALARYREALAFDPHDVDWDELTNDDVKALPDIARTELELPDGVAWAAPVGVVLHVLPVGDPPPTSAPGEGLPEPLAELEHARDFLRALIQATQDRGANALDARRRMRALAPQLLAAYLQAR